MYIGSRPNAPHGTATNRDPPCHPVAASNSRHPPATDAHDTKLDRILRTTSASPAGASCTGSRGGRVGRPPRPPTSGARGNREAGRGGKREGPAAAPAPGRGDPEHRPPPASSAPGSASALGQPAVRALS